ncbi:MAG TPA: universal stress protein [Dehalococcoidia bacterium]|jgi:nucleotide-binding universal stress UspA family protein
MFKLILVGLDGSAGSKRALGVAIGLAVEQGAELRAVSVEERLPHYAAMVDEVEEAKRQANEYFQRVQREAYDHAKQAGIELQVATLAGHAAQRIMEYATAEQADLLVLGHSGHSSVWGQFMGTTADKLVRHAPCSVLIVR